MGAALVLLALALTRIDDPRHLSNTWYLTRASGLIAYLFLWVSVSIGLLQSTGGLQGLSAPVANIGLHEDFSLWSISAAVFHAAILLFDRYVLFRLSELLVPFRSEFQPVWTGLGTIALYIVLLSAASTYLRHRLPPRIWRALHLSSLLGLLFALVHGVMAGTDTALPTVAFFYRFSAISLLGLLTVRLFRGGVSRAGSSGGR